MTAPHGETVVVIPARGGSKGVPRKNLRRVGGVPLIARAVDQSLRASGVDRVVVSTDDAEIAAVAREWGADVVDRPVDLAGDTATSESALQHALDALEDGGVRVDVLVFVQATSPFLDVAALDDAIERVRTGDLDVAFAAIASWGFLWRPIGASAGTAGGPGHGTGMIGVNHDLRTRPRRQDREPEFLETGAFYVMRADGFRAADHRFFGRVGVALVDEATAIEIDTEDELRRAIALAPLLDAPAAIDVDVVVTDFDGVHTDDSVLVGADGSEFVTVDRTDGMGVAMLRRAGVPVLILSTETNPVVAARGRKLGVEVIQGQSDKAAALQAWADANGHDLDRVAYLGNDVNDLGCLGLVGWPVAVPESHPRVLAAARIVLGARGGRGAVRELAERVLQTREDRTPVDPDLTRRSTP